MGIMQKTAHLATGGLMFKEEPAAKAAAKRAGPKTGKKQTGAKRSKPQAARRTKPQTAQRRKPQAKPPGEPQAARMAATARMAGPGDRTADQLERLAKLHRLGELTDEEFAAAKARVLGKNLAAVSQEGGPGAAMGSARFKTIEANVAAARHLADLADQDRGPSMTPLGED